MGKTEAVGRQSFPGGYSVLGDRYSVVDKKLGPSESFVAEQGTMLYMSDHVKMRARFAGMGFLSGEAVAKVRFTNEGDSDAHVGLATNLPMGVVVPIRMSRFGGQLNCKRGAYMAGDEAVKVLPRILPARSLLACCVGGMPPVIQSLRGDGVALLNAGGTLLKVDLDDGEQLVIDTNALVAFTEGVGYDVRVAGSCLTCCCGGEGCFNTELTGPGTVYLESLSYSSLLQLLVTVRDGPAAVAAGAVSGGGGEGGGDGGGGE